MELVVQDSAAVRRILARICTYATLATAQVALLLSVVAEPLLRALMERSYWEAHRVVPWIAAGYVVLGLEHHFATGMHYARQTAWATWIGLGSLGVLVICNWFWLPAGRVESAAIATLVSMSLRSGLFLWVSQRYYAIPYELPRLAQLTGIGVVLFLLARAIHTPWLISDLLSRGLVGSLLLPALWWSGFFTQDEREAVQSRMIMWQLARHVS
jgi:O-antigen/teichoic acid export membrane protein